MWRILGLDILNMQSLHHRILIKMSMSNQNQNLHLHSKILPNWHSVLYLIVTPSHDRWHPYIELVHPFDLQRPNQFNFIVTITISYIWWPSSYLPIFCTFFGLTINIISSSYCSYCTIGDFVAHIKSYWIHIHQLKIYPVV